MKYSVEWDRWESKKYNVWTWDHKKTPCITDGHKPYPTLEEALQRLRELLKGVKQ